MLERQAAAHGDRRYLRIGNTERTFAQMRDAVARAAGRCQRAWSRASRGDHVREPGGALDAWFACAWLGAILVPLNTAPRGPQLAHVLGNSGARSSRSTPLFGHLDLVEALPAELERIWALDGVPAPTWRGLAASPTRRPGEPLAARAGRPGRHRRDPLHVGDDRPVEGRHVPARPVLLVGRLVGGMLGGLDEDDVLYTVLPLFHTNALNACVQALVAGAPDVGPRFSASRFWPQARRVRRHGHLPARRDGQDPRQAPAGARGTRRTASAPRSPPRRRPSCTTPSASASASRSSTASG